MFLLRHRPRGEIVQAERLTVSFADRHKTKRIIGEETLGFAIREVEKVGIIRSLLDVNPRYRRVPRTDSPRDRSEEFRVQRESGARPSSGFMHIRVKTEAAEVKGHVRRLRPQEAEKIDAKDAEIKALQEQIRERREERAALVREAWTKAHAVTVKELVTAAEEREEEFNPERDEARP